MRIACFCAEDINLGLGYIMAYLKKQGHDVRLFFDPLQYNRGYANNGILAKALALDKYIIWQVKKFKPDICLFSCVTATYQWALKISEQIKKETNIKIIFGGIHPTLVPEEVKKHSFIDEVVQGDGIEYFGGKFEPDVIWPDREVFYKYLPPIHRQYPIFMTSFGCPFNCSFCGNEQLRAVKQYKHIQRDANNCIGELKQLKKRGARYVLFVDDIFTVNKSFLDNFLPAYKKEIDLPFACFGHTSTLDKGSIENLKSANCHTIWLGIQTGDERLRKQILHRPELNKDIIEVSKLIKDAKIKLMVDHIFGIPTENIMSQDISYNLYDIIKPDVINCYELVYFPKAKIMEYALRSGNLQSKDVQLITEGKGIRYQLGNKNRKFFDEYAKSFIALPVGGVSAELFPVILLKLIAHLKAGRSFILQVIIQNEIWFTVEAIWKKLKLFLRIP